MTNMLKHTRNTNNNGIRFYKQIYNEQHCTKTAKMLDTQNCLQNYINNAKATKLLLQSAFYTSNGSTYKVLPFYDFSFKFYDRFCSPTRSLTFYAYLITKIGNRKLNASYLREDHHKIFEVIIILCIKVMRLRQSRAVDR